MGLRGHIEKHLDHPQLRWTMDNREHQLRWWCRPVTPAPERQIDQEKLESSLALDLEISLDCVSPSIQKSMSMSMYVYVR